jgi:hypothetical protein
LFVDGLRITSEIKMGHGGKRIGAGRKRKIASIWERWHVGSLCEELRREKAKAIESAEQQKANAAIQRLHQRRQRFLIVGEDGRRRLNNEPWDLKRLSADVDKIGRSHQIIYVANASRDAIICVVAKKTGHPKRMVQRCWVEWRAMLKRWRADLDDHHEMITNAA